MTDSSPITCTVELRLTGETLEPQAVSQLLGLVPSHSMDREQCGALARRRWPFWGYNGRGEPGFQDEWGTLEEGLRFLLICLAPRKTEIIRLASEFDAVWWCGHFQSSFGGGPRLSAELMADLGGYRVPLAIENYFSTS